MYFIFSFMNKRRRLLSKTTDTKVGNYKFVGIIQNGDLLFRLLIFTSEERTHCYEFFYDQTNDVYYCNKCKAKHSRTSLRVDVDDSEKVNFKFGKNEHICQPIEYLPENYKSHELPLIDETLPKTEKKSLNKKRLVELNTIFISN